MKSKLVILNAFFPFFIFCFAIFYSFYHQILLHFYSFHVVDFVFVLFHFVMGAKGKTLNFRFHERKCSFRGFLEKKSVSFVIICNVSKLRNNNIRTKYLPRKLMVNCVKSLEANIKHEFQFLFFLCLALPDIMFGIKWN